MKPGFIYHPHAILKSVNKIERPSVESLLFAMRLFSTPVFLLPLFTSVVIYLYREYNATANAGYGICYEH